jgi:hypothetical protein
MAARLADTECMMGAYTLRHNKLCGAGCKFIRRGPAWYLPIPLRNRRRLGTRIGGRIQTPRKLSDAERKRLDRFRPDIFIQHDMTTFHIVELKCCKDTAPDKQCQNAMDKHQELVAELRSLFGGQPITVLIHPIMIGVTVTIYKEFYDTMDLLGVSKVEAKRCAAVMHSIAVSYVDIITTTKWQQERRGVG